jgi:hypothetical protein
LDRTKQVLDPATPPWEKHVLLYCIKYTIRYVYQASTRAALTRSSSMLIFSATTLWPRFHFNYYFSLFMKKKLHNKWQHINECFKCYEKIWLLTEVETITPLIMWNLWCKINNSVFKRTQLMARFTIASDELHISQRAFGIARISLHQCGLRVKFVGNIMTTIL